MSAINQSLKHTCTNVIGFAVTGALFGAIAGYGLTNTKDETERKKCAAFAGLFGAAVGAFSSLVKGYDQIKTIGVVTLGLAKADLFVTDIGNLFSSMLGSVKYCGPQ